MAKTIKLPRAIMRELLRPPRDPEKFYRGEGRFQALCGMERAEVARIFAAHPHREAILRGFDAERN